MWRSEPAIVPFSATSLPPAATIRLPWSMNSRAASPVVDDPIPQTSKHALNLTGYFENDWLSARASHNDPSKFFINIDRVSQLNQGATESLDASINLKMLEGVQLTADAVNLTNNKVFQYSGTETRFRGRYDNGRIFYAGVRLRY